MAERYDIAIIGAGMVGATLACALGDSAVRVAVIEAREADTDWPSGSVDLRVSAVTAAAQQIFHRLGAWRAMRELGVSPFREMRVWDAAGAGAIHFDSADAGAAQLGHIVENRVIQRALLERLRRSSNLALLCPQGVAAVEYGEGAARVCLDGGGALEAALVVGADGANSRVRREAGIATRGWSYHQQAVVAVVSTECPHRETAWQRFLPGGPLAFLPLADGRSSIVWSTATEHAQALLAMGAREFLAELTRAFAHRLGEVAAVGPRAAFPLRLQHATAYVRPRLALVGDAAHTIHPLAGQGVNLGLLDAAALAQVLLEAHAAGADLGALAVLRRYERWRKGDNLAMTALMDALQRLFSAAPPAGMLRGLGLDLVDALAPLKRRLMRHAMGMRADLPRLARCGRV